MSSSGPEIVCPTCGMSRSARLSGCPNCSTPVPKRRQGDLSAAGWVVVTVAFIVIGVIAGLNGFDRALDAACIALLIVAVIYGVYSARRGGRT